ncbi:TolC family protein [Bdellovibrio sp. HCB-110]|uniref:TolC family protein n=1 Tax=Bdellovibrio sp. HCB-110 TaxID=3391182 RepID=UPI0039B4FED5
MRSWVSLWMVLVSLPAWSLTLPESVGIALQKSSVLKQQTLELEKSELSLKQSKSAFLPSLDLTASYIYNDENPNERTYDWDSSAAISVTENFYDHGLSLTNYKISKSRKALTELDYRREKSSTVLKTVQIYLEVLKTQKIEELQIKNMAQVEKVYNLVVSQYKQGLRTRQDFLRFEAQYQRAILAKASAEYDTMKAREDLKVYLDLPETPVQLSDYQQKSVPVSTEPQIYESEKRHLTQELRTSEEKLLRIENRPRIDVVGKFGYGSDSYFHTDTRWSDNDKTFWNVGLTFNWNLWDWGQRGSAVKISHLESLRQDVRSSFDERDAKSVISKLQEQVRLIQKQYDITEKLFKVETENFTIMERYFREGKSSFLDYSTSLSDLISVQIQKIQTEYNLIQTRLELEHRKGYLDEKSVQ